MRRSRLGDVEVDSFNWKILKDIFPYLIEYKRRVLFAVSFMILAKVASVGLPFILKYIVDDLDVSQNSPQALLVVPIGLVIAYGFVRFSNVVFGEIRDLLFGRVTERSIRRISLNVFKHLHTLDLEFHLDRRTGGLARDIERGASGINFLMRFMVFNIVPTLLEISMVIGVLIYNYAVGFSVITFVAIIAYVSFSVITTDWRVKFIREANKADSESNNHAIDSLLNYETTKYFSNEHFEAQRYDKDLEVWELAKRKNRLSLFALNGGQALIISVAVTAMMMLAAQNVANGIMTLGDFVLINAFIMQIFMPLNFLGFVYREIKGSLANIEHLFKLMAIKPKITNRSDAEELQISSGQVKFENVSFAYNPNRSIINNVSFTVESGEKVAIVGPSGHGKSTLMKLLFRFYDTTDGAIYIDDQNIKNVTMESLRGNLGVVPQDTVLFNDSIFENVRYGRPTATDEEVESAIALAHLDDFISKLPDGAGTIVGERGLKLSGGEKQRVAIARTILKNPRILIFDEATSSLDSHSEQAILSAFKEISKSASSLVIAHRLSTIVDADKILFVENGEIAEQGAHEELLQIEGKYASLWRTQLAKESVL
ncbi:ABC transporter ATP-binding protein/permease [Pseudoalteromonas haloplanktis]|uniref:ABCB family ABC transporter ATP-binding protein/permease n=1 Tax=Pseudoalteromonas sp. bablab_jr004 TaxID=2755065 RepID=UPI0018F2B570|nr:ABC transporter ATP-binding protein/permease [Pseudoalteromonas sp. bablab_jr004]MBN4057312.1 ABC transporter ATP-binding protein/permease [Pseudoalteromonas haloplanktis]